MSLGNPQLAGASPGNGKGASASGAPGKSDAAPGHNKASADAAAGVGQSATSSDSHVTSGLADQPQPLSNADLNPGGANNGGDCGAYCSTRDGSPSANGSGEGNANGKPCAGCVGRADNKNPPGQALDGSDHNNGYECDGNSGIGKTNPAHTGCQSPPPPPCQPTPANGHCGRDCVPTPANGHCGRDCVPTPANHNCTEVGGRCVPPVGATSCNPTSVEVLGTQVVPIVSTRSVPETPKTEVLGVEISRGAAAPTLARTGGNSVALVDIGLLLILGGVGTLFASRRRRPER